MRNITRCDICGKEEHTNLPRIPEGFMLINGFDMCKPCRIEYHKENNKLIKRLMKERDGDQFEYEKSQHEKKR